ncbi:MAG: multicopper oxidase domain-containing protein [Pseudonocardiales bacterium]|nr:multicopper oxidase domain-containing protein [Pseudonocardiales bacterium]
MTETTRLTVPAPSPPTIGPQAGTGLTKFLDPVRIPPVLRPGPGQHPHHMTIELRATKVSLHSELPPTTLWTYAGHSPGPTIEVRRGQPVHVTWRNEISGRYPLVAVEVEAPGPPGPEGPFPQVGNTPGRDGAQPNQDIANLPPWTVVHLHGARTDGSNDGLPENAVLPGRAQVAEYANDQQATTLWYHDHAMGITRLNVVSGLFGMYLIRDEEEDKLHLPGGEYEIPLIICDRNLDTDPAGRLTGQLLYKVANLKIDIPGLPETRSLLQFFGPYTSVNGVIWPHLDVAARWYRFRILNASNGRFYRLFLLDEHDNVLPGAIKQIGTDQGLLPEPVSIEGELTLAPAERADVLIDFSAFRGRHLRLVNTGGGAINVNPPIVPGQTDPGAGLVEPDVMQFRVSSAPVHDRFELPKKLSRSFVRLTHDSLPHDHGHRWVVTAPGSPAIPHPELWEMAEVDPATVTIPSDGIIQVQGPATGNNVITLRRVARRYEDASTFSVEHGAWEIWNFLNIPIGPAHPMHIHLVGFQALSRHIYHTESFDPQIHGSKTPIVFDRTGTLDPNEQGWKDTIRVNPGEMVSVAGQFVGGTGRYVYHCHLLDHEDEGMMRSFVVMPGEVMKLTDAMPHMTMPVAAV